MKTYRLFTTGPGGQITNRSLDHSKGGYPWIVKAMVPPRLNKAHMTGVNRPVSLTLA
jgi:hypothetical protein